MDYSKFFEYHLKMNADITISVKPIFSHEASEFGILRSDKKGWIKAFVEKPKTQELLDKFQIDEASFANFKVEPQGRTHVASMGIYIFKKEILFELLNESDKEDFGGEIIPDSLDKKKLAAYFFDGYWEDIGTMRAFFEAHFELTQPVPRFNFYDEEFPFYTNPRFLPASKITNCQINQSVVAEGSILLGSIIENSIIGIRSFIETGTLLQRSIIMGNMNYETLEERSENQKNNRPNLGIGNNCIIRNAIVDMNCKIGNNVQLINKDNKQHDDGENYAIREGIIVIPKGSVITDNTII